MANIAWYFFKDIHFIWNQQSFPSLSFIQTYVYNSWVIGSICSEKMFLAGEAINYQLMYGLGTVWSSMRNIY